MILCTWFSTGFFLLDSHSTFTSAKLLSISTLMLNKPFSCESDVHTISALPLWAFSSTVKGTYLRAARGPAPQPGASACARERPSRPTGGPLVLRGAAAEGVRRAVAAHSANDAFARVGDKAVAGLLSRGFLPSVPGPPPGLSFRFLTSPSERREHRMAETKNYNVYCSLSSESASA